MFFLFDACLEKAGVVFLFGLWKAFWSVIAGNHDLTLHRGWYEKNWEGWHYKRQVRYMALIVLL